MASGGAAPFGTPHGSLVPQAGQARKGCGNAETAVEQRVAIIVFAVDISSPAMRRTAYLPSIAVHGGMELLGERHRPRHKRRVSGHHPSRPARCLTVATSARTWQVHAEPGWAGLLEAGHRFARTASEAQPRDHVRTRNARRRYGYSCLLAKRRYWKEPAARERLRNGGAGIITLGVQILSPAMKSAG